MVSLSTASEHFSGLVHPSAARDEIVAARHRAFIAAHLAGGVLAFAAMPLILLMRGGAPEPIEIAIFAWLVAPILAALDLSRYGKLERAHFISIASFAGLILTVAAMSGGVTSFAMVWLPVLAFEAAFSGSRRVIVAALGMAGFVVAALFGLDTAGLAAAGDTRGLLPQISALMAVLYTAGLALRWDSLQKVIAEARHGNETRYRLLAENMTDLVTHHTRYGAVVFASPAAERLLGAGAHELHGRGFFERVHVADRPIFLTALSGAASRRETVSAEFRVRRQSAENGAHPAAPQFTWVEIRCRPLETPAREGEADVIAVTREISERKHQEGTLEAARADADRANAAKGHFLANMSHELRTPLNAIIGFSELLANDEFAAVGEKKRQEYAGLIHDSGLHLLSVVNGILDMSRIESGNFPILAEPFAIRPVIDSCVQLFALKASGAAVTLDVEVPDRLPDLMADKRACKQILINLLSNAIKFTPAGGRVRVAVHEETESLRIEVADTGVGVDAEDLPHLGNSFFQARSTYDRPYEGTGLGLSVVKGLVGLHGGGFEIQSRLGEGTSVLVRLPVERDADAQPVQSHEDIRRPAYESRRAANG